jgi:hypothetical protein
MDAISVYPSVTLNQHDSKLTDLMKYAIDNSKYNHTLNRYSTSVFRMAREFSRTSNHQV